MMINKIHNENCLDTMKRMEDNSVDAIVTDPPYGLSFMGKKWDYDVPSVEIWKEALRILKPGGHLLSFAGTCTQHRMAVNIEDAGFEIRDMIAWVYGSGFPKSLNVSKAIDKATDADRAKIPVGNPVKRIIPGSDQDKTGSWIKDNGRTYQPSIEIPSTIEAQQWDGWGTALKPALEPITVARKPLSEKTVAANVLKWGTGSINIDGCRVGLDGEKPPTGSAKRVYANNQYTEEKVYGNNKTTSVKSRFPANFIHDGSQLVLDLFPQTKSGKMHPTHTTAQREIYGQNADGGYITQETIGNSGSAARFFYCAKANKKDREIGNNHPTVKPTKLMRYLCRLVTPPNGLIYDPFTGSGSTGKAAILEGFLFIGSELEKEYCDIAKKRTNFSKL